MSKILLLFEYPTLNGGEYSLLAMVDRLLAGPWRFFAAAPSQGPLSEELRRREIPLHPLSIHGADGARLEIDEVRRQLRLALSRWPIHLAHANSLAMTRLAGPVASELGLPSLGHLRDIVKLSATAIRDVNRHTRLLAVSRAVRDFHVQRGLEAGKISVLYNGIDTERFAPRPPSGSIHQELQLGGDEPLVGSVGQIIARKGIDTLVEAARIVLRRRADAHFVHVGERYSRKQEAVDYERRLREAVSTDPLQGRFHFLGTRADVPGAMNEFRLLAHAARQEPLGRVLLEASASGLPVVATRVGGTSEIYPSPDSGGLLVAKDDAHDLAEKIQLLLNHAQRVRELGEAGRRRVTRSFLIEQQAACLAEHYRQVLE